MVEKHLKKSAVGSFINQMYGDSPHTWHRDLEEREACRYTMPSVWRIAIHLVDETSYSGFF
jgi:hypothetical protein